eukprot:Filipodium_phascolosomae@DN5823_c0_g1_i1.p1
MAPETLALVVVVLLHGIALFVDSMPTTKSNSTTSTTATTPAAIPTAGRTPAPHVTPMAKWSQGPDWLHIVLEISSISSRSSGAGGRSGESLRKSPLMSSLRVESYGSSVRVEWETPPVETGSPPLRVVWQERLLRPLHKPEWEWLIPLRKLKLKAAKIRWEPCWLRLRKSKDRLSLISSDFSQWDSAGCEEAKRQWRMVYFESKQFPNLDFSVEGATKAQHHRDYDELQGDPEGGDGRTIRESLTTSTTIAEKERQKAIHLYEKTLREFRQKYSEDIAAKKKKHGGQK